MPAYDDLITKFKEIRVIETIGSVMGWDQEVYIPPTGFQQRAEQMALLQQLRHRMFTSPTFGKLLEESEKKTSFEKLDVIQKRNVHLIRRDYDFLTKIPEELVAALAKQRTLTTQIWKKAKAKKDWKLFEPELTKLVKLVEQRAEILMEARDTPTPYDALLDYFEPKMTQDVISRVFSDLRNHLVPLVDKYTDVVKTMDFSFLNRPISIEKQRKIAIALSDFIQYDVTSDEAGGRIDETEHPFTTGYFDDVRITTHYYEDKFASSLFSVLHEAGHAIYEQNFPQEYKWLPIGESSSYGIHESQSRFVENVVGRSPEFINHFFPKLNKITDGVFKDIKAEDMTHAVNSVERSKIRIEADEVTYSLHVIIRFEIERELFAGKIDIPDLPSIWNDKYDKYLGVTIDHDSEGVMQDTHWASAYHGYFPSYALGNIYGGQFLQLMEKEIPDWLDHIAKGNFGPAKQWMVNHVHKIGRMYDPEELVKSVTGEGLNAQPFIDYLTKKYKRVFDT